MRRKSYAIVILMALMMFLGVVGLKTVLGWWTGDWKSPLLTAVTMGLILVCLFERQMRASERNPPDHSKREEDL